MNNLLAESHYGKQKGVEAIGKPLKKIFLDFLEIRKPLKKNFLNFLKIGKPLKKFEF
jgi:hypothetical protein